MRGLVQRVSQASVTVNDVETGSIGPGLCLLVGVTHDDDAASAEKLAHKVWNLRVMEDASGAMNRSIADTTGEVLVISQFTLYGDNERGRRPSWVAAASPDHAEPLIECVVDTLRGLGATVGVGEFGADMQVALVNDGPVTLLIET